MAFLGNLPPPSHMDTSDDGLIGKRWKDWLTVFNMYLAATGVTDDAQKKSLLLYLAGPNVQRMYETLNDSAEAEVFNSAVQALNGKFIPKTNII